MKTDEISFDIPVLETERLILRKLTLDDLEDMYEYGSDDRVSEYVSWNNHRSLSDTKSFLVHIIEQYENREFIFWGIELKENNKLIGTINFVSLNSKHKVGELGYILSRQYWGKGIMTEAVKEVIKFGFKEMGLARIQAKCFVENIGSEQVMKKVGMTYEGTIRKGMLVKGKHHDLKMYSILVDEKKYFNRNYFKNNNDHNTSTASKVKLKLADNNYLPEIIELHKDDEVREMLGVIEPPDENYLKNNDFCYIILDENDDFIGIVELYNLSWKNRRAELSIIIKSSVRGKGYGYDALNKIFEIGFYELGLNRIWLRVLEYNRRAIELYKRVGFVQEGINRNESLRNGQYYSQIQMSILKSEWER